MCRMSQPESLLLEHKSIKYKDKVVFEKIVMSTRFRRVPKLFAEDEACFLFLTKGAFNFRTPTNLIEFREGDGMLSKCGNYLIEEVTINPDSQLQTLSAIGAFFYPAMVKQFFQADLSLPAFQQTPDTAKISIEPLMKSFVDGIDYLLDHQELADENMIVNKLKELLLLLSKSEKAASIHAFVASLFVPQEYNFNTIIQQNVFTNLSLDELAFLCNMSLATFKRRFTEHYGQSPAKYILNLKLERAAHVLHLPGKSIADIAFECGFDSVSHFDKVFKKQYGKTPTAYRAELN